MRDADGLTLIAAERLDEQRVVENPSRRGYIFQQGEKCLKNIFRFLEMSDCFVIVNCLNTSNNPLCYTHVRSIFSHDERLSQLKRTITSIRERMPDAKIILAECSKLSPEQFREIDSSVQFEDMSTDQDIAQQRDSPYKGATEIMILHKLYPVWSKYKRTFKLSGRYELSSNFSVQKLSENQYNFIGYENSGVSTVFYSVPECYYSEFQANLEYVVGKMRQSRECIEYNFIPKIEQSHIHFFRHPSEKMGVTGKVSVDGSHYDA